MSGEQWFYVLFVVAFVCGPTIRAMIRLYERYESPMNPRFQRADLPAQTSSDGVFLDSRSRELEVLGFIRDAVVEKLLEAVTHQANVHAVLLHHATEPIRAEVAVLRNVAPSRG